jgi:glutamine synthetase type III
MEEHSRDIDTPNEYAKFTVQMCLDQRQLIKQLKTEIIAQKQIISQQNNDIADQFEIITQQNDDMTEQYELIEQQKNEIDELQQSLHQIDDTTRISKAYTLCAKRTMNQSRENKALKKNIKRLTQLNAKLVNEEQGITRQYARYIRKQEEEIHRLKLQIAGEHTIMQ